MTQSQNRQPDQNPQEAENRQDPRWKVIHADMDAFFASVEVLDDPSLKGLPLIIGHPGPRGVVSTASYEAREFGVHSALPSTEALRRCPEGVWRSPRGGRYGEISRQVMQVFREFTPLVEPLSVDEAFLDIEGSLKLYGGAIAIAHQIRERVFEQTGGLTVSIGVAPNKFLAKLASDLDKPDGLTVVDPDGIQELLDPLPVQKIWGVGPKTTRQLNDLGLHRIEDLRNAGLEFLMRRWGERSAQHLWALAHGRDSREVHEPESSKSISTENTFTVDIMKGSDSDKFLRNAAEEVCQSMRQQGFRARTVRLKVRASSFRTLTRSKTLETPFIDAATLYNTGRELLTHVDLEAEGIRLLGLGVSGLVHASQPIQGQMFVSELEPARDATVTGLIDQSRSDSRVPPLKRGSLLSPPPEKSGGGKGAAIEKSDQDETL